MSEDPKLFDAGDYNLFRYCHNDPEDMTDPMGLEDFHAVASTFGQHMTPELQGYVNARDAMAKWADSSNNSQDTFAHFAAGQGLTMGQVTKNAVLRDKDGKFSSGEHFPSQAKASSKLIDRSFTAQELSGDTPKKQYEYSGYGSRSKNDPNDYIIFGPYRGGRERGPYNNTSSFSRYDPSPDGYYRAFVVYTHPFYRTDVDPGDRVKYSTMEGKPRVYLATPQPRGSHLSPPYIIDWPNP